MKLNYEEKVTDYGNEIIVRTDENGIISFIPKDPANSDYQRYLRWLENPNEEGTQL
jgi:hypothetical protein